MNILPLKQNLTYLIVHITTVATIMITAAAHAETDFDPVDCARIQNVDVPFEVDADKNSLSFTNTIKIEISDKILTVSDKMFMEQPETTTLHQALRVFLNRAAKMAIISAELGLNWDTFAEKLGSEDTSESITEDYLVAITNMCKAILDLDKAQSTVQDAFPAFIAPVDIQLHK